MNILIINGPNLNMLGKREKNIYGEMTLKDLNDMLIEVDENLIFYQSNFEGEIINKIHDFIINENSYDGLIVNMGGYTHTSVAIHDALKIVKKLKVEVHLSDIENRDDFRKVNFIKDVVDKSFIGEKEQSYLKAVKWIREQNEK